MRGFPASVVILDRRGPIPTEAEEALYITQAMVVVNSFFYSTTGGSSNHRGGDSVVPQIAVLECSDSRSSRNKSRVRFLYSAANKAVDTSSFAVLKELLVSKLTRGRSTASTTLSGSGISDCVEEDGFTQPQSRCPLTQCLMRSLSFLQASTGGGSGEMGEGEEFQQSGGGGGMMAGQQYHGGAIVILREQPHQQLLGDPISHDTLLVGKKRLRCQEVGSSHETLPHMLAEYSAAEMMEEQSMGRAGFLTTAQARGVRVSLFGGGTDNKSFGNQVNLGKGKDLGAMSAQNDISRNIKPDGEVRYLLDVVQSTAGCYSATVLNFHALAYLMVPPHISNIPTCGELQGALQPLTLVMGGSENDEEEEEDAVPNSPGTAATVQEAKQSSSRHGDGSDSSRFVLKVCSQCLKTVRGGTKCGYCF